MVCRFALSGTATGPEAPTAGVVSGRFAVSSSDGSRIDAGMSLGLRALPSPRAELGGELTGVLGSSASAWPLIRPAGAIASSTEASVAAVDPFDVRLRSMGLARDQNQNGRCKRGDYAVVQQDDLLRDRTHAL